MTKQFKQECDKCLSESDWNKLLLKWHPDKYNSDPTNGLANDFAAKANELKNKDSNTPSGNNWEQFEQKLQENHSTLDEDEINTPEESTQHKKDQRAQAQKDNSNNSVAGANSGSGSGSNSGSHESDLARQARETAATRNAAAEAAKESADAAAAAKNTATSAAQSAASTTSGMKGPSLG